MTASLFSPLPLAHGPAMRNRMMLAPLTNLQSNEDGTLGDDEYRWLLLRAQGGLLAHDDLCGERAACGKVVCRAARYLR